MLLPEYPRQVGCYISDAGWAVECGDGDEDCTSFTGMDWVVLSAVAWVVGNSG